jgi:glutathione reductase (NADPH)
MRLMSEMYDLMVIGTGVAGNKAAEKCARYGLKVAISDNREMGGTCGLRGCNPKKVLTTAAAVVDQVRRMKGKGISQGSGLIWAELMNFKREFTDHIPGDRERSYDQLGIDVFRGETSFVNESSVNVGSEIVEAKKILVATGAIPQKLGLPGEELMITSDGFLEMETLPHRILFVGGGYISFEFAQVAAIAGAEATIIQRGPRVLKHFNKDLSERIVHIFKEDLSIDIRTNAALGSLEKRGESIKARCGLAGEVMVEADVVVHGAGRVPNIGALNLEAANVEYDARGIEVNGHMQSVSNLDVYAAGDATAEGMPLSPVADMEAYVLGENIVKGNRVEANYEGIPTVVFTNPPMASVGMDEAECISGRINYKVKRGDMTRTHTSRRVMARHSEFKILVEEATDRILGAHIMGHRADEVINIFGMAIRYGLTANQIKSMPFAFPSDIYDARYMV